MLANGAIQTLTALKMCPVNITKIFGLGLEAQVLGLGPAA